MARWLPQGAAEWVFPGWVRWTLLGLSFVWVVLLTWQLIFGTLWQDAIPLEKLTDRSEEAGIFWAFLPSENRARLPVVWSGFLEAPAQAESGWSWQRRGARELVQAPGEYTFTASTVWLRIPDGETWASSVLHVPRAVSGPWLLVAWGVFLIALGGCWPGLRSFWGKNPPSWWVTVLLFLAGAFLFSLWRKPEWLVTPQLVNEDVWVFAYEAWQKGLSALGQPYAGYWHLLPRLGAALTMGGMLETAPQWWPLAFSAMAWGLTTGLGLLLVFSRLCSDWRGRLLMGWALFWVPHGGEVYFQLYNIQWVALSVLFVLVIQPPAARWGQRWLEAFVLLLLGLTTPGVIFALPLLVIRLVLALKWPGLWRILWPETATARRGYWLDELPLIAAGGLAVGVQLASALVRVGDTGSSNPVESISLLVGNFFLTLLPSLFPAEWGDLGTTTAVVAALLWAGGFLLLWAGSPRSTQWPVLLLCGAGFAILVLGFVRPAGGTWANLENFSPQGEGSRYYFFFGLSAMWGMILMLFHQNRRWTKNLALVLFVVLLFAQSTQVRTRPQPDFEWAAQAEKLGELLREDASGDSFPLQFPFGNIWEWNFRKY